ncbi:hypothetical protein SELMODRAFT_428046 [Selaginella moellendorffii]|uniref:Uncharacterized protein n=1 Tax=Selaginella moellendorffii TaxID=88036 RepID=D8T1I9_SELML|nr:hypothetical protein SELMODRAFT_428046 [Selaginella moellendorffii]
MHPLKSILVRILPASGILVQRYLRNLKFQACVMNRELQVKWRIISATAILTVFLSTATRSKSKDLMTYNDPRTNKVMSTEALNRGDEVHLVGLSRSMWTISRKSIVINPAALLLMSMEVIEIDNGLDKILGVLADGKGRVKTFWATFFTQALAEKNPSRRQVLQMRRCFADSKSSKSALAQNDMLLAINKGGEQKIVTKRHSRDRFGTTVEDVFHVLYNCGAYDHLRQHLPTIPWRDRASPTLTLSLNLQGISCETRGPLLEATAVPVQGVLKSKWVGRQVQCLSGLMPPADPPKII